MIYFIKFKISNIGVSAVLPLELQGTQRAQLYGHVAPFFLSFYNFNNVRIITNKIFKKYVQDKRIVSLFLRPKDIKKVLMEGNGRENKKMVPTLTTLP
jgi:hypothetical protein